MKKNLTAVLIAAICINSLFVIANGAESNAAPEVAEVASMYKGIVKVDVELGAKVKKGQLLFELSPVISDIEKEAAESDLSYTKQVYEGSLKLIEKHAISVADFQECVRDYYNAKAKLDQINNTLKTSKYYSPFDGTVTKIVRYTGSGLGDNDGEVYVTQGNVQVDTKNRVAAVCTRYENILHLNVKLGQEVKKGELLFTTDTKGLEIQLEQHKNMLEFAQHVYDRETKLHQTNTVSLLKTIEAKNNYIQVVADVKKDQAMIEESKFTAPFDGKVTKIYRYSGTGIGAGKPVVEITASE